MKITSITCVKNECDIIETFIRVNSAFINKFIFIDESEDGTSDILRRLQTEGFDIICLNRSDKLEEFKQDQVISTSLRFAIKHNIEGDYFLLLDCDEFPKFANRQQAIEALGGIPKHSIGAFQWETYVPDSLEFNLTLRNSLQTNFRQRLPEGKVYEKIVVPRHLADQILISVGSHRASRIDKIPLGKHVLSTRLAHFPVRSVRQIIKKNVSAVYWLLRKKSRYIGEGIHVFGVLKHLVDNDFDLSLENLQLIAFDYANARGSESNLGGRPDWINDYELRYLDQAVTNTERQLYQMLVDSWARPFSRQHIPDLLTALGQISDFQPCD